MSPTRTLLHAAGAVDGRAFSTRPGRGAGVLIESEGKRCVVLAAGEAGEVTSHPRAAGAERRDMSRHVLLPALVNAHTHLDLSTLGPRPFEEASGFVGWLGMIRRAREQEGHDPGEAAALGCRLLRRGGVAAVGDIAGGGGAGQTGPVEALRRSGIEGVSFVEAFGMGARQARAIAFFESLSGGGGGGGGGLALEGGGVRLGLQPHAPYSAGLDVYRAAARLSRKRGVPVATHLGESMDERRFVREAAGSLREFLASLGVWDDSILDQIGRGRRPVEHLAEVLGEARWLVVHVNDCTTEEIEILARTGAHVVYCPRAAASFHHERALGAHRYREMLKAGVNVALGTDSVVSLPGEEADRLSTLDEMRFLWRRDRTDPATLLTMATVNGARALGMDEARFTLAPGALIGLIAVDVSGTPQEMPALQRVLESNGLPEWVWPADGGTT